MARFTQPKRVRLFGDTDKAATFISVAESYLGTLAERLRRAKQKFGRWEFFANGAYFVLVIAAAFAVIEIHVESAAAATIEEDTLALWLPRGIVVYPSSDASTTGWGTPNVFVGSRFDSPTPGLDVTKWTAGGALGEVLLTPNIDNGYPSIKKTPLPLFFETPDAKGKKYKAPKTATWAAYRAEFDTYRGLPNAQALFTGLDSGRLYCLPFRGRFNPSLSSAKYVVSSDFGTALSIKDHDLASAAAGYKTATQRQDKDGLPKVAHESITRATDSGTVLALLETDCELDGTTFEQSKSTLAVSSGNGLNVLTASQQEQWVAYGVRQWTPDDVLLPTLSWDDHPSLNRPALLTYGAAVGGDWVDLDAFEITVRGVARKTYSKHIYANGRIIAELPSYVVSAAVRTSTTDNVTVDRLLAVTWQKDDQDAYAPTSEFNRVHRLWYVDVPRRGGIGLALEQAPVGQYDASTNPSGWHYAGKFDAWDPHAPDPFLTQGLMQSFAFSGDGTRAVSVIAVTNDAVAIAKEYTFDIGESFAVTRSVVHVADLYNIDVAFPSYIPFGIEYKKDSYDLVAVSIVSTAYKVSDPSPAAVVRWSGAADKSNVYFQTSDLYADTVFESPPLNHYYQVMLFVHSARIGAATMVRQDPTFAHDFFVQFIVNGEPRTTSDRIADPAHTGLIAGSPLDLKNYTTHALPLGAVYRDDNYVCGIELGPNGTYLASDVHSSIGDIAALTQTPGSGVRFFPAGVV